jgi:hypothetical protein
VQTTEHFDVWRDETDSPNKNKESSTHMQTLSSRLAIRHSSLRHRFILLSSGTIVSPNFFTRTFLSSFALSNNYRNMSTEIPLKVKLLSSNATFPTKGSELALISQAPKTLLFELAAEKW